MVKDRVWIPPHPSGNSCLGHGGRRAPHWPSHQRPWSQVSTYLSRQILEIHSTIYIIISNLTGGVVTFRYRHTNIHFRIIYIYRHHDTGSPPSWALPSSLPSPTPSSSLPPTSTSSLLPGCHSLTFPPFKFSPSPVPPSCHFGLKQISLINQIPC